MNVIQISDWRIYKRDGEQFLSTARKAFAKKSKAYSMEALYNVVCMGIEKLVMAYLMKNGDLADNHTMPDLLDALRRHTEVKDTLAEELLYLGSFQEICDEDNMVVKKPTEKEVTHFLTIGDNLEAFLLPALG